MAEVECGAGKRGQGHRQAFHIELRSTSIDLKDDDQSVRVGVRQFAVRGPVDDLHRKDLCDRSGDGRSRHREFQVGERGHGICRQKEWRRGDDMRFLNKGTVISVTLGRSAAVMQHLLTDPAKGQARRVQEFRRIERRTVCRSMGSGTATFRITRYLNWRPPAIWVLPATGLRRTGMGHRHVRLVERGHGQGLFLPDGRADGPSHGVHGARQMGHRGAKEDWLPPLAKGEMIGAFALTEPGAGSAIQSLATEFTRSSGRDSLVLNGSKKWITCAQRAGLFLVFGKLEQRSVACLVPRETPGPSSRAHS